MARQAREISGSGIYHVMMRGINRQNIFEDAEDYHRFTVLLYQMAHPEAQGDRPPVLRGSVPSVLRFLDSCLLAVIENHGSDESNYADMADYHKECC